MSGSDSGAALLAATWMPAASLTARAPGRPASGPGSATAPAVVDGGFGALPWAGVLSGGPIGTPEFYDRTAETAAARSYGRATPFEPPGFPDAYPAPGVGYAGPAR